MLSWLKTGWGLFLATTVGLGLAGGGYAAWTTSLSLQGEVQTGNVNAVWDYQEDNEYVQTIDPNTGAISGLQPVPPEKDVVECVSDLEPGAQAQEVGFQVIGAYPSYTCEIVMGGIVTGTVPVHVAGISIDATDAAGNDVLNTEFNAGVRVFPRIPSPDGEGFVCDTETPLGLNSQLHQGDRFCAVVRLHATQDAQQDHTYSVNVWVHLIQWNLAGAAELPVLSVAGPGISEGQAQLVATQLGIPTEDLIFENGVALYINPETFHAVPHLAVSGDDALFQELLRTTEETGDNAVEGSPIVGETFNFDALSNLQVIPQEQAMERFGSALGQAQASPPNAVMTSSNTMFETYEYEDGPGTSLLPAVQAAIDTRISHSFMADSFFDIATEVPIIGPGAHVSVNFAPNGEVSQFMYSANQLSSEGSSEAPVISPEAAAERCRQLLGGRGDGATLDPQLVYFSPSPEVGANLIVPHYSCNGTTGALSGNELGANLVQHLVPAIDDPRFVPTVELTADNDGSLILADAAITGGRAPYSIQWTSSNADLSGFEDQTSADYDVEGRDSQPTIETLTVTVTDANGITVQDTVVIVIGQFIGDASPSVSRFGLAAPLAVGGVTDFGIERAVSDMCANNVNRYSNRMDNEALKRFHWTGQSAWERDFKGSSAHDSYVDNVDQAFYCGHGWGGGFTFESNVDDGSVTYLDPRQTPGGDWGDLDLEWLNLLSCQVLKGTHDGLSWASRWGPAFDGLHLLTGFQTNAYDWSNFGKRFAEYQMGKSFFFTTVTLNVRSAWFQASAEEQPNGVQSVVMGVIGRNGMSNYNDYFWGQGPVGPDIRGSNKIGYWRVVQTN